MQNEPSSLRRWLRAFLRPKHPPQPDWDAVSSYTDLARLAGEFHWIDPDAFLAGPFRRFLDLCSIDDGSPRGRARVMEFGRGALFGFADGLAERGGDRDALIERGMRLAKHRLRDAPNGDYMLEVLEGISNHNWRGTRGDAAG